MKVQIEYEPDDRVVIVKTGQTAVVEDVLDACDPPILLKDFAGFFQPEDLRPANKTQIMIRFESVLADKISRDFGPFSFVQIAYTSLRIGPGEDWLAYYDRDNARWKLHDQLNNNDYNEYTDVIIWAVQGE